MAFCKNCGQSMNPYAAVCTACGFSAGAGQNFCANCGAGTNPGAAVCTNCGAATFGGFAGAPGYEQKSKLVAGLLQIFLGGYGVGRFYLGYTSVGVFQILASFACGAGYIWGLIDGVMILSGTPSVDARGVPLKD